MSFGSRLFYWQMKNESDLVGRRCVRRAGKKLRVCRDRKRQGELAELAFLYKASAMGFGVAKPYGDSRRYDFILDSGDRLWRVQVKSRSNPRGHAYSFGGNSATKRSAPYTVDEIDVLVAYVVPENAWYVIPVEVLVRGRTLILYPGGKCRKGGGFYEKYREEWDFMKAEAE